MLSGIRGAVPRLVAVVLLTVARGIFVNLGLARVSAVVTLAAAAGLLLGTARVW